MTDDERDEAIIKFGTLFEAFVGQYGKDEERKETARIEDREDRRKWRDEMMEDNKATRAEVAALKAEVAPVVSTHKAAVSAVKWGFRIATPSGLVAALAWVWHKISDRLG